MHPRFVHLHVHSAHSLTDSTLRVEAIGAACAAAGIPAVAVSDTMSMFGAVQFYKAATKAGVKPIIGCDLAIARGTEPLGRLTALAKDAAGYRNLCHLLSRGYIEGRPTDAATVDIDWLAEHAAGIVLLAGLDSPLARASAESRHDDVRALLGALAASFDDDRLYLELTRTGRAGEDAWTAAALALAAEFDLPVVATNDVRFLAASDFDAHEARVCIASGQQLADPNRPRTYTPEQYLKTPDEMCALFADIPEAIENAVELAKRCSVSLSLGSNVLPAFPVPEDHDAESWLRSEACEGLDYRLSRHPLAPGHDRASYQARLDLELGVINTMGFAGYFLIVADFIGWAKNRAIPVGPGRGSGAGSLVAWALGITDLDPLPYNLLFERFLNPERVSMPDFDIDFCINGREAVIAYVAQRYGRERVAQIATVGTMAAKGVLRDVGRVLGLSYGFVDSVARLIPAKLEITLADALGESAKVAKDQSLASADLIARYRSEDEVRRLIDLARQLEDLPRNAGKHAGGVVIAPTAISDYSPLYADAGAADDPSRSIVTQFDKDDVEAVGLVKFDFLGLRTLTIIDGALKSINRRRARAERDPLDINAIPLDDPAAYKVLADADTVAVFQFESQGIRRLLKRAKPDCFEDIIALAALYRPGPLGSGMDGDWVDRKHGNARVTYPHPLLEPVLAPTYGVIVYQEQVMQIAQVLAGYTLGGADLLRRAMGKKKPEEMAKERAKFESGAAARGVDPEVASGIFDLMEKFGDYGFNKSHAAAYSLIAYQTAWLKAHYPAEFMASVLSSELDNTDKLVVAVEDARRRGITLQAPDINESTYQFIAVGLRAIRYGLGGIKGVGMAACKAIVLERRANGPYASLADFIRRLSGEGVNKRTVEALIKCGAMDGFGCNRATLMAQIPTATRAADQAAQDASVGQIDLFGNACAAPAADAQPCDEWSLADRLTAEREALGYYLSGHPLDPYREDVRPWVSGAIGQLPDAASGGGTRTRALVAGQVMGLRRSGDDRLFLQLDDGTGRVDVAFMGDVAFEYAPILKKDGLVFIEGTLRDDAHTGLISLRASRAWPLQVYLDSRSSARADREHAPQQARSERGVTRRTGVLDWPDPTEAHDPSGADSLSRRDQQGRKAARAIDSTESPVASAT
jgi:DNA polymerase III subunit alpha